MIPQGRWWTKCFLNVVYTETECCYLTTKSRMAERKNKELLLLFIEGAQAEKLGPIVLMTCTWVVRAY